MHIIGEIPHPKYKLTIFKMNHRMALKIEDNGLEQWYKFRDGAFTNGVQDLKNSVDKKFMDEAILIFESMQKNKLQLLTEIEEDNMFDEIV